MGSEMIYRMCVEVFSGRRNSCPLRVRDGGSELYETCRAHARRLCTRRSPATVLTRSRPHLVPWPTWWTGLGDPRLSGLIDRAIAGNLDLKKARGRVREARARRGVAKGGLFPTLDFTGSATRNWVSGNNMSGGSPAISSLSSSSMPTEGTSSLYNAGFDAAWEVDIFGGLRRSVEAAEGDLQASEEDLRDVLVSLVSEVATNYVEVRTYQARLAVAEENLKTQSETYRLTVWQSEAGLNDELNVQQARYNLENTRSQMPDLTTGLEGAINQIAVLLGDQPGTIHRELQTP